MENRDCAMTSKEMYEYGYKWYGMIPITAEEARKIASEVQIFKLYTDNTEGEINDKKEITDEFIYGYGRLPKELKIIGLLIVSKENYESYIKSDKISNPEVKSVFEKDLKRIQDCLKDLDVCLDSNTEKQD